MRMILALIPALIPALTLTMSAASAGDYLPFRSPSGNIHCMLTTGIFDGARCDIFEKTPSFPSRPASCDLDWGTAFEVGARGPGRPICVGDTVAVPEAVVLPYGGVLSLGGVTCRSERTGMTCTNATGGGFTLARRAQRVF